MKDSCFLVLLGAGVTVGCAHRLPASANGHWCGNRDFGKMVAGSYLVEEKEWPTASGKALSGEGVVTFGADGTFLGEFTLDFGADHPPRDENFEKFSEVGIVEVFLAVDGADPLNANAKPSIGPFRHSAPGRRIRAPF